MIGIIGAMEEEVDALKQKIEIVNTNQYHGYIFYEGTMCGEKVILLQGGIGKVNAAISATLLLTHYDIEYVINIGSAGGVRQEQNVGDVVISSSVVHHDVDVTAFQREIGEIPGMPLFFKPDNLLLSMVEDILKEQKNSYHIGLIASGDQFVAQKYQFDKICHDFPDVMCVEMEAASIAQVCHVFHTKFIITRSLSDIYNKGENHIQFDEYLKKASLSSANMCYSLISKIASYDGEKNEKN